MTSDNDVALVAIPHLPLLRHLTLDRLQVSPTSILPLFAASPLQTVHVEGASPALSIRDLLPLSAVPPLPPSLRRISVHTRDRLPPGIDDELRHSLAEHGISIATSWEPSLLDCDTGAPPPSDRASFEKQADAVKDDARWIAREVEWLCELGDGERLQELVQAMTRVRQERRIKEH